MNRRDIFKIGSTAFLTGSLADCQTAENDDTSFDTHTKPPDIDLPRGREEYCRFLVAKLCEHGPRPTGSEAYNKAAESVKKEFERSLDTVFYDTFDFEEWRSLASEGKQTRLEINGIPYLTVAAHYSDPTPKGGVDGVVSTIDDESFDYAIIDTETKEILAYLTVNALGPAVPLFYDGKAPHCPPIFCVGINHAVMLENAALADAQAHAECYARYIQGSSASSVVAQSPGTGNGEIIVIAHLDTVYTSPGANDNTASVGVLLLLAHQCAKEEHGKTITFIATAAEEHGYRGAKHYVAKRIEDGTLEDIDYVINFDSLTYGPNLWVRTEDKELFDIVNTINSRLRIPGNPIWKKASPFFLDNEPFKESNARGIAFNSRGYNEETLHLWHRPEDIPETVHYDTVESSFQTMIELIRQLDNE